MCWTERHGHASLQLTHCLPSCLLVLHLPHVIDALHHHHPHYAAPSMVCLPEVLTGQLPVQGRPRASCSSHADRGTHHQLSEVRAGSSLAVCCRSRPQGHTTIQSTSAATSASGLMAKEAGAPSPGPLHNADTKFAGDIGDQTNKSASASAPGAARAWTVCSADARMYADDQVQDRCSACQSEGCRGVPGSVIILHASSHSDALDVTGLSSFAAGVAAKHASLLRLCRR